MGKKCEGCERIMSVMDPEKKRLAQQAKKRHFRMCRKCRKKFRSRNKCPRCGSKNWRQVHREGKKKQ